MYSLQGYSQAKDTIILFNGQLLIGEVKSADLGRLTIDETDLGILNIKQYKIRRMRTVRPFRIETDDKTTYYGTLEPSQKDGWVYVVVGQDTVEMDIVTLNSITPVKKGFFAGLDGTLSAGFSYTKSSEVGQVNMSTSINHTGRRFEYYFSASENASIDTIDFSRDREQVNLTTVYNLTPAWVAAAGLSYQRNLQLSIKRRYQEFIGAGNKLIVRKHSRLILLTGMTFNQERSTSDDEVLSLEVPLLAQFNFYKFQNPNIQVSAAQTVYFSMTQKGRIRSEGNVNFAWQIVSDFDLSINPYMNYDNQPPSGSNDFDYGVVISISYKF